MSRTYRHTNKDQKILRGEIVSYSFDNEFLEEDDRRVKKLKGNVVFKGNERQYRKYLNGHYQYGVPKKFRQKLNRKLKARMKQEIRNKVNKNDFDGIGEEVFVRNAAWYYF